MTCAGPQSDKKHSILSGKTLVKYHSYRRTKSSGRGIKLDSKNTLHRLRRVVALTYVYPYITDEFDPEGNRLMMSATFEFIRKMYDGTFWKSRTIIPDRSWDDAFAESVMAFNNGDVDAARRNILFNSLFVPMMENRKNFMDCHHAYDRETPPSNILFPAYRLDDHTMLRFDYDNEYTWSETGFPCSMTECSALFRGKFESSVADTIRKDPKMVEGLRVDFDKILYNIQNTLGLCNFIDAVGCGNDVYY